jgi:hypothetical protein
LPNSQFSQFFNLLRLEPNSRKFLLHVTHHTTALYASNEPPVKAFQRALYRMPLR